jgi:hypothetical protein
VHGFHTGDGDDPFRGSPITLGRFGRTKFGTSNDLLRRERVVIFVSWRFKPETACHTKGDLTGRICAK